MAVLGAVATILIVFAIIWILDLTTLSSYMGSIGGIIGGVLGVTYMRRLHDERFTHIMNRAARNVFVYLMFLLPMCSVVLVWLEEITLQIAALLIFVPWMSSLVIYLLSLFYYYRK